MRVAREAPSPWRGGVGGLAEGKEVLDDDGSRVPRRRPPGQGAAHRSTRWLKRIERRRSCDRLGSFRKLSGITTG